MKSLKEVFEELFKKENSTEVAVFDYADAGDFNRLWQMENLTQQEVLILWPGTPLDPDITPIDTIGHLTPLHWALCLAKKAADGAENKGNEGVDATPSGPKHRVTILDLCPWESQKIPLCQLFNDLNPDRIPWIRVVQPCDLVVGEKSPAKNEDRQARVDAATGSGAVSQLEKSVIDEDETPEPELAVGSDALWLLQSLFPKFTEMQESFLENWTQRMGMLLQAVGEELSSPADPDNRHAIANLIGPMILGVDREKSGTSSKPDHCQALKAVLTATGHIAEDAEKPDSNETAYPRTSTPPPAEDTSKLDSGEALSAPSNLELVLIDDQAHHGWGDWLKGEAKTLFQPKPTVTVVNEVGKVEHWITRLTEKLKNDEIDEWIHDLRFCLNYSEDGQVVDGGQKPQILFLDLRLFAGQSKAEEARFYLKVLELWKALADRRNKVNEKVQSEQDKRNLPWPDNISAAVVGAITEACKGDGSGLKDDVQLEALTLLPRVLAQLDLSLPIVIFSSTGQRDIIEKLKGYGNIITDFQKPRFFGTGAKEIIQSTCTSLRNACAESIRLLSARATATRIQQSEINLPSWEDYTHFEIYFDESLRPEQRDFRCGGLLVGFKDIKESESIKVAMEEKKIVWFSKDISSPDTKATIPDRHNRDNQPRDDQSSECIWKQYVSPELSKILGADRPLLPFVLFRSIEETESEEEFDLISRSGLDNRLIAMVKLLLEVVLFEVLPHQISQSQLSSIYAYCATRKRPFVLEALTEKNRRGEIQGVNPGSIASYGGAINVLGDDFKSAAKSLIEKWGIKKESIAASVDEGGGKMVKLMYNSLDSSSMAPIALEVLRLRSESGFADKVSKGLQRCLGFQLKYFEGEYQQNGRPNKLPQFPFHHLHYLADFIAGFASRAGNGVSIQPFDLHGKNSQLGLQWNADFERIIDASRRIDGKDVVGSLIQISKLDKWNDSLFLQLVANRLATLIRRIQGSEFVDFSRRRGSDLLPFQGTSEFAVTENLVGRNKREAKARGASGRSTPRKKSRAKKAVSASTGEPAISSPQNSDQERQEEKNNKITVSFPNTDVRDIAFKYLKDNDCSTSEKSMVGNFVLGGPMTIELAYPDQPEKVIKAREVLKEYLVKK